MKPRDRQAQIAGIVYEQGEMSVDALAAAFDVSLETIRRDLGHLAELGRLRKIHGGARRIRLHSESSFQERMNEDAEAKRVIAHKVTDLVETGDTIFIDTGSTTLVCAEMLARSGKLTVITNSVRIAQVFSESPAGHTVFLLGGTFSADNAETGGPLVLDQIEEFQADHALITVAALDPDVGAMDSDFDEAQVARAMITHSRHVFVLASPTKFRRKAAFRVCRLDEIDVVVSDGATAPDVRAAIVAAGVELR